MKSKVFCCMVFIMTCCTVEISNAGIIGVSFFENNTDTSGTMQPTDLAGAPGVRVGNWNDWSRNDVTLGDAEIIKDDSGATVSLFSAIMNPLKAWASRDRNFDNDRAMFSDVIDVYDTTCVISVSNVPYSAYDVYVYMRDDGANRGGIFAIGNTTYYARGGGGNPLGDGTGYILSSDTTLGAGTDVDQGNYVCFSGISGSSFALNLSTFNAGNNTMRNKVCGFQIVEVPEPATLGVLGLGSLVFLRKKK